MRLVLVHDTHKILVIAEEINRMLAEVPLSTRPDRK